MTLISVIVLTDSGRMAGDSEVVEVSEKPPLLTSGRHDGRQVSRARLGDYTSKLP